MASFDKQPPRADADAEGDDDEENDETSEDVLEEGIIQEEYKIWKKNSPFLYDTIMTTSLEWPSLTCQWMPDMKTLEGKEYNEHSLLLGTHTSGDQNYLMVASVSLPSYDAPIDARKYDDEKGEVGGFGAVGNKVDIRVRIKHEGEVNRARYCPHNPFLVATKSPSEFVYVFDISKHPSVPPESEPFRPQHTCHGHSAEGYGLAWSHTTEGHLLSGAQDSLVVLWDMKNAGPTVKPLSVFRGHTATVEDVAWHGDDPNIAGSVGSDRAICIWDVREKNSSTPTFKRENAHSADINCIAFNPISTYLFATGGGDHNVNLWDLRNLREPMAVLKGHKEEVFSVCWAPFNESVLASGSGDRRVNVWDLSRIGDEQDPEDAQDGPPELLFIHGGHTSRINDLSFNKNDEWTIASVSEDNVLQVWHMAENIYADYEDEDEGGEGLGDDDLEK